MRRQNHICHFHEECSSRILRIVKNLPNIFIWIDPNRSIPWQKFHIIITLWIKPFYISYELDILSMIWWSWIWSLVNCKHDVAPCWHDKCLEFRSHCCLDPSFQNSIILLLLFIYYIFLLIFWTEHQKAFCGQGNQESVRPKT